MDFRRNRVRWPLALLIVAVVASAVAVAPQWVGAVPHQQATSCKWTSIGNSGKDLSHVAGALDTDADNLYLYSGFDSQLKPAFDFERADLSTAGSATHSNVGIGGTLSVVGAAGAYRSKGDDSATWWIGGIDDAEKGTATSQIQRYVTKTNAWDRPSVPGTFAGRAFAAAAYDPAHDVIWVTGGIANCSLTAETDSVLTGDRCTSKSLATAYMTFDATTGEPSWNVLSGADLSLFGHSMVYDSTAKRMLVFGGTTDIQTAKNQLRVLDLTDADPANAKWVTLSTSGTAPSIYFHGAAYDAQWNWMVTYGGVARNYLQDNENTNTKTMALNLGVTPPMWTDLKPSGSPGQKIGPAMDYDATNKVVIVALGRQQFVSQSSGTPVPPANQRVSRGTFALECSIPAPTATRPTTVATTPSGGTTVPGPGYATPTLPAPQACPGLDKYVPAAVIANALTNPQTVQGWGQLCNPNVPATDYNPWRGWLSLQRPVPYDQLFNGLVYKCGCP